MSIGLSSKTPQRIIPREEWVATIEANKASDTVFWRRELVSAKAFVELPFWLLTESDSYALTYRGCKINMRLHNNYCEVSSGARFFDSRRNLIFIGPLSDASKSITVQNEPCAVLRPQKTVIEFDVKSINVAFTEFLGEDIRSSNRANQYFSSLAFAHIPFLNILISAYRSASRDPYAFEVSEWDVPIWWFTHGDCLIRTGIMPYWNNDTYPSHGKFGSNERTPYLSVTASQIQYSISHPSAPGRSELLDALSLMYRGRFNDAIRSIVTAIEVVVEEKLAKRYRDAGHNEQDIKKLLDASQDSFHKRIAEYEQVSRRRLPGPYVHMLPWLNGLRLKEELEKVRSLRHKIVHKGVKVASRGQTQQAIETMTWLYDWFAEDHAAFSFSTGNYEYYSTMRGHVRFPWQYATNGVYVRPISDGSNSESGHLETADETSARVFARLLDPQSCDLELFVRMAFSSLGIGLGDAPTILDGDTLLRERYRTNFDGSAWLVFCVPLNGLPMTDTVEAVAATCILTSQEEQIPFKAIAVFHHEQHLSTSNRKLFAAISDKVATEARVRNVAILTGIELRQLVQGVANNLWTSEAAKVAIFKAGRNASPPPGFRGIGSVRKFFDDKSVISVQLDEDCHINTGELFYAESSQELRPERISSLHLDNQSVVQAVGPVNVGLYTSKPKSAFKKGCRVFVRSPVEAS